MLRYQNYARDLSDPGQVVANATITIYNTGTLTLATIFGDNLSPPTPKSNPFTSDAYGYYFFYGDQVYDVRVTGGTPAVTPYTLGAIDLTGGGGVSAGNWFNVKDYGATGNGVTNDQTAIDDTIAALNDAGGGVLYFPEGDYLCTQFEISDNTWVNGDGSGASQIKAPARTISRGIIRNAAGSGGNDNLRITDITIRRTTSTGTTFNDLVYFENCTNIWIQRCAGIHTGDAPISAGERGFSTDGCRRQWITDNYLLDCPDVSIGVAWSNGSSNAWDGDFSICNNVCEYTNVAADERSSSAIVVTASNGTIDSNIVVGNASAAIEIGDNQHSLTITKNILRDNEIGNFLIAGAGTGATLTDMLVADNLWEIVTRAAAHNYPAAVFSSGTGSALARITFRDNTNIRVRVERGSTGTFSDVLITGRHRAIEAESVTNVRLLGVTVSAPDPDAVSAAEGGINIINCLAATVDDCLATGCENAGFYFESTPTADVTLVQNCRADANGTYGFKFEQPQNIRWVDCSGEDNGVGLVLVSNPLLAGNLPFSFIRLVTTGAPSFYTAPGSVWYRTDGDALTVPVQYIKASAATNSGGWQSVELVGTGTDISTGGAITLSTGSVFQFSPSTNVTSIAAAYVGRTVNFVCASGSSSALVDGSNLFLAGDWTPGMFDTITLQYIANVGGGSTGWFELCRSNN